MVSFLAANWQLLVVAVPAALASLPSILAGLGKGVSWVIIAVRAPRKDLVQVARALGGRDEPDKPVT